MFGDVVTPDLGQVAVWTGRGLSAYAACYVALAEERAIPPITDDQRIIAVAAGIARPAIAL